MKTNFTLQNLMSVGIKQSAFSIIGNFLATGISALAIILISRQLGPEMFGEFSVGFAISLILVRLVDMGLNTAILKIAGMPSQEHRLVHVFTETLFYKLILIFTLSLIGYVIYIPLAEALQFRQPLILLLSFSIGLITAIYEHLLTILQALHKFSHSILINFIQASVKLVGMTLFFILSIRDSIIIYSWYVLAPIAPVLLWKFFAPKTILISFKQRELKEFKQVFSIAKHSSVAFVSAGIIENIDVLFLQRYLSTYEAGLYSGVSRIAMVFALVAYSLANVLNARVSKYRDKENLSTYLRKCWAIIAVSAVVFLLLIPLSSTLIHFTIGAQYSEGADSLILLLGSSFLTIATVPFIALFYSFKNNWYFSVSGILQLGITLVGNYFLVPSFGLDGAAWTRIVARVALFLFTIVLGLQLFRQLNTHSTET